MTIPQTSYPAAMARGVEGQLADASEQCEIVSRTNTAAAMYFGRAVEADPTEDDEVDIPGGATSGIFEGVTVFTHAIDAFDISEDIPRYNPCNVLQRGRVLVVAEVSVAKDDKAYYRYQNAGASPEAIGRFRNNLDGVADVWTITPTAVNDTHYQLEVQFPAVEGVSDAKNFTFQVLGDGSATAEEICDDFRTQMAADAAFTALCVATGTTTLILTGQVAGLAMTPEDKGPGILAPVNTVPATADARRAGKSKFVSTASSGALAILEVALALD